MPPFLKAGEDRKVFVSIDFPFFGRRVIRCPIDNAAYLYAVGIGLLVG